ncbi:uncharacterized protein [Hoplias malabaricus]|uniref:uncharacterized protein n=1 Tax=Hoplias malabaricus TaxID=27720 RepID=UPI0034636318
MFCLSAVFSVFCVGFVSVYFLYEYLYCKPGSVLEYNGTPPGTVGLIFSFIMQSVRKKRGKINTDQREKQPLIYTLTNCRYEELSLRRYCSTVGYGWDYPDSTFRDIPLFYPQYLCSPLMSILKCSQLFCLSPYGLACVSERVCLRQPLDELKKGAFSLQVGEREYRKVESGVEVDLSLCLRRDQKNVEEEQAEGWSSIITLLSPITTYSHMLQSHTDTTDECVWCVSVLVPWWARGVFSGVFLPLFFSIGSVGCPASLWGVSRCLAETEKVKGADAVRAPLSLTVRYSQPLLLPKTVNIRIFQTESSQTHYSFHLEESTTHKLLIAGEIQRP